MSTTVVLPAAFPLVGLGLASTYFLTVSPCSYQRQSVCLAWMMIDDLVVPGKQGYDPQEGR